MTKTNFFLYVTFSFFVLLSMALGIISLNLLEERDYYRRTTYDPERFSILAPNVRALMKDMIDITEADSAYVALFHNGVDWANESLHPPYVNKVFQWNREASDINGKISSLGEYTTNVEIVGNTQNIPIDSVAKIYDTLEGRCVGVILNGTQNGVELRCPINNQRGNVVGYYAVILSQLDQNQINRFLNLVSLYQIRFSDLLFIEQGPEPSLR